MSLQRHRDEPGAVGAPERPRPLGLPARRAAAPADAAQQPDRGLAAAPMAASVRRGTMTLLTQAVMVRANIDVDRMSAQQKVELADEIYVQQPNLLASILVLPRYGVDMLQLEVPIHVLLVAFQAMKHCGHALPTISEDVQEICLQRLTATMKFTEGVPPDLVAQMITKFCVDHPERYLLAFVYGHLGEHDLLRVRTDAEKYLLLAALNLVECVAYVGAQLQSK
jgi:hypothetical protein